MKMDEMYDCWIDECKRAEEYWVNHDDPYAEESESTSSIK